MEAISLAPLRALSDVHLPQVSKECHCQKTVPGEGNRCVFQQVTWEMTWEFNDHYMDIVGFIMISCFTVSSCFMDVFSCFFKYVPNALAKGSRL